jgi:predicted nucleotidyltransferase
MIDLIENHRAELEELCRRFRVKTLEVFGSAADGKFDPTRSDLDFLVEFFPMEPGPHSKAYFGLWFALQELFRREVDLVEVLAIQNPYFLKAVNQSRQVLYAA